MAKYKAEFETSGEIMEYEGDSFKHLYDIVKFELRWSLTNILREVSDERMEIVRFYVKSQRYDDDIYFASMYARNDPLLGKIITLAQNGNVSMIWERPSNKMWEG